MGVPPSLPPYALPAPEFRFRQLADLAGRAPIGGAREVALACFLAARLAEDARELPAASASARGQRSSAARGWLGTLALPAPVRAPAQRCLDSAASGSVETLAGAVRELSAAAAPFLDSLSLGELDALSARLAE